jgi:hypothetical protein
MANLDRRMRNLDSFLLFLSSIFGLSFSFLYALLGYREIVYGFLPLLINGLVIPIYIGYVRGAILLDTLEERVRGWIYFIYGIISYILSPAFWAINKLMLTANIEFEIASRLVMFIGIFAVSYFLGAGNLRRWFCHTIFKVFNREMTKLTDKIYIDTGSSAFSVSLFLSIAFIFSISSTLDAIITSFMVVNISFGVAFFVWNERDIRRWIDLLQFSEYIDLEYRPSKFFIPIWIGKVFSVISLLAIAILLVAFKWIDLFVQIGLVIIVLIGYILVTFSFGKSRTMHVKKKGTMPKDIEANLTKLLHRMKLKTL